MKHWPSDRDVSSAEYISGIRTIYIDLDYCYPMVANGTANKLLNYCSKYNENLNSRRNTTTIL